MNEHYRSLEHLFQSAPLNQGIFAGSELAVGDKKATYRLSIEKKYFHAANAMHGAVYFKLLDDAAYFAAASVEREYFILTKSYEIRFVRPVGVDELKAEGEVVSHGDEGITAKSTIYNGKGKVVAYGEGVFVKGPKRLVDLEGYKAKPGDLPFLDHQRVKPRGSKD